MNRIKSVKAMQVLDSRGNPTVQVTVETFDGSYDSLLNKPFIPLKTSELVNDNGLISFSELEEIGVFEAVHQHDNKDILDEEIGFIKADLLNVFSFVCV